MPKKSSNETKQKKYLWEIPDDVYKIMKIACVLSSKTMQDFITDSVKERSRAVLKKSGKL